MNTMDVLRNYLHSHKSCESIRGLLGGNAQEILTIFQGDHQQYSKFFECACALEHELLLWEQLPEGILRQLELRRHEDRPIDRGIDCADPELRRVIQAKWYGPQTPLSLRRLGTFMIYSEVIQRRGEIAKREIIHGEETRLTEEAARALNTLEVKRTALTNERLLHWLTVAMQDLEDRPYVEEPSYGKGVDTEPYPHQVEALRIIRDKVERILSDSDSESGDSSDSESDSDSSVCNSNCNSNATSEETLIHDPRVVRIRAACGSGKSGIIAWLLRDWINKEEPLQYVVLVPSIILQRQVARAIQCLAPDVDLTFAGDGQHPNPNADVCICIYNSIHLLDSLELKVVLVDEAHHLEGAFYADPVEGCWRGKVFDLKAQAYVLMSATLRANEPCDFSYDLGDAIKDKRLVDFSLITPVLKGFSIDKRRSIPANLTEKLSELVASHPEWTRILAYCNSRESGKKFTAILNGMNISAQYFDGTTHPNQREVYLRGLERGEIRVLCTVQVLGEGIDIPSADTCLFVEPRRSAINVVQCVGRVLRLAPGKSTAYVVCPSLDEKDELRSMLRKLGGEYPELKVAMRKGLRPEIIHVDGVEGMGESEIECLRIAIQHHMGLLIKNSWDLRYEELKEYLEKNGGNYPKVSEPSGLGKWINDQRNLYRKLQNIKNHKFSNRFKTLEELPGWCWNTLSEKWNKKFIQLREYVNKNGKYPTKGDPDGFAQWIDKQRQKYKSFRNTTPNKLFSERFDLLITLPNWSWGKDKRTNLPWEEKYKLLVMYLNIHKNYPKRGDKDGIAAWLCQERRKYKIYYKNNPYSPLTKQFHLLEKLPGWKWIIITIKNNQFWEEKFNLLKSYIDQYGSYPKKGHPHNLSIWVSSQKKKYKLLHLTCSDTDTLKKFKKLENLPMWKWDIKELKKHRSWDESFKMLQNYLKQNNSYPTFKDPNGLGKWLHQQRQNYKIYYENHPQSSTTIQFQKLESLPEWKWNGRIDLWEKKFSLLKSILNRDNKYPLRGDANKLSTWMCTQRCNYQEYRSEHPDSPLSERLQKLENLPGWTWDVINNLWNEQFQSLKKYLEMHGSYPTRKESNRLRAWMAKQRSAYKKHLKEKPNLPLPERLTLVGDLPGWKWVDTKKLNNN